MEAHFLSPLRLVDPTLRDLDGVVEGGGRDRNAAFTRTLRHNRAPASELQKMRAGGERGLPVRSENDMFLVGAR